MASRTTRKRSQSQTKQYPAVAGTGLPLVVRNGRAADRHSGARICAEPRSRFRATEARSERGRHARAPDEPVLRPWATLTRLVHRMYGGATTTEGERAMATTAQETDQI